MKKVILFSLFSLLIFNSCEEDPSFTWISFKNMGGYQLYDVKYGNSSAAPEFIYKKQEITLDDAWIDYSSKINNGSTMYCALSDDECGSEYIYFKAKINNIEYQFRTNDLITVFVGTNKTIVFDGDTDVIQIK